MIKKEQILNVQKKWAEGVIKIGSLKDNRSDCKHFAEDFINELYAFNTGLVLFKPTKCVKEQFRYNKSKALSYFIAGDNRECSEDEGFALKPWKKVRFENADMILEENRAIAMGNYYFKA